MSRHLAPSSTSEPPSPAPAANLPTSTVLSAYQRALFAQRLAVLIQRLRRAAVEDAPNEH